MLNESIRVFMVDQNVFHAELVGRHLISGGCSNVDLFGDLNTAFQAWELAPQVVVLRAHSSEEVTLGL